MSEILNPYSFNQDNPRFTVLDNFGFIVMRISILDSFKFKLSSAILSYQQDI